MQTPLAAAVESETALWGVEVFILFLHCPDMITPVHSLSHPHEHAHTKKREKQQVQSHNNLCMRRWEVMNNDNWGEGYYCQWGQRQWTSGVFSICMSGIFLAPLPAPKSWRHMKGPEESQEVARGQRSCQVNTLTQKHGWRIGSQVSTGKDKKFLAQMIWSKYPCATKSL